MISFIGYLSSYLKTFKISIDKVDYHQLTRLLSHLSSLESLELCAVRHPLTGELISLLCASAQFAPTSRWQSLRVRVNNVYPRLFKEKTTKLLLELIDKGFDLRVIGKGDIDLLQEHLAMLARLKKKSADTHIAP